jgi:branched-chain amino acid transport system ATP-binding protein
VFELCNLTAGYGTTTVLRDVSLVVPAGSVVALLGSNGAGKTTLLRAASGLIPARGRITLDGKDLSGHSPHDFARAGICHVPEGRGIFRSLTVRDNILLQAGSGSVADAIDRAVSVFPILGQRLGQIAGTLSGGQQQMLALARAYVTQPKVVLLDEVSMGLAPVVVDEIFDFLGRLAGEGTSLLIVEQYVTRALKLSDYVFLLNRGQVGFAGEPAELDVDELFTSYMGRSAEAAVPV